MGHVREIREEDDDTLTLPQWMFAVLKVREGDPLCLSLDLQIQDKVFLDAKHLQLTPLTNNFLSISYDSNIIQKTKKALS